MKNKDKVWVAQSIFGLLFGSLVIYGAVKTNDGAMAFLGMLVIYATLLANVVLFAVKHEKKIKEWMNK